MIVQLTDIEGYPCLVNLDAVVYAVSVKQKGGKLATHVSFGMPDAYVMVMETPEELMGALMALSEEEETEVEYVDDEGGC